MGKPSFAEEVSMTGLQPFESQQPANSSRERQTWQLNKHHLQMQGRHFGRELTNLNQHNYPNRNLSQNNLKLK